MLINLIGNSLKFTFAGSITVQVAIVYDKDSNEPQLEIKVCDTGIGIKVEDRPKIFKMFSKLESTSRINTSGVGLGLSICKKIVEALDGYIYLEDNDELLVPR